MQLLDGRLAPYASQPGKGRGRRRAEPAAWDRNDYQRDRDRIVHSTAFRRLVYKTQVFLNHEGDLFRTRLTHSLEVAMLARSLARHLQLHEDLVEAIALAHDLGHTPFGHAGQDALNVCMARHGGFEHNLQSLRVVDLLESSYPDFSGLNLSYDTREGVLKHCSRRDAEALERSEPGGVGARFLSGRQPSLEAQLCNIADEITYCSHDVDDGLRAGLLDASCLEEQSLLARLATEVRQDRRSTTDKHVIHAVLRALMRRAAEDLVAATRARLKASAPRDVEEVRESPPLVGFSDEFSQALTGLKRYLFAKLYRHPQVVARMAIAQEILTDLFEIHLQQGSLLASEGESRERACADYLAGMTDRFAIREHERLTGQRLFADTQ